MKKTRFFNIYIYKRPWCSHKVTVSVAVYFQLAISTTVYANAYTMKTGIHPHVFVVIRVNYM